MVTVPGEYLHKYNVILCDLSGLFFLQIKASLGVDYQIMFVNFILQEGLAPINLIIEDNFHRAAPGGTGGVKTIGNYASVTFYISIYKAIFTLIEHATYVVLIYLIITFATMHSMPSFN
jgi:hypothetical protein